MSEEKPIYYLNTLCSGAYNPPSYPISASMSYLPSFITISEYNSLLSLYMARGDEITRLQAVIAELEAVFEVPGAEDKEEQDRLQAVVRNVTHYLIAKRDIGELSPVEDALLLECEKSIQERP